MPANEAVFFTVFHLSELAAKRSRGAAIFDEVLDFFEPRSTLSFLLERLGRDVGPISRAAGRIEL